MSERYFFKTEEGSTALPVDTNTSFYTGFLNYDEGSTSEVYFEFYDDEEMKIPVTPTGGTISCFGSPLGNSYLQSAEGNSIQAGLVSYPNATYTPPVLDGLMFSARIDINNITGANFMKAVLFLH